MDRPFWRRLCACVTTLAKWAFYSISVGKKAYHAPAAPLKYDNIILIRNVS